MEGVYNYKMNCFQTINPYTFVSIAEHLIDSESIVQQKINASQDAFRYWGILKHWPKAEILKKLAILLRVNKTFLGSQITAEMGKPITESLAEVEKCALTCEFYATHAATFLQNQDVKSEFIKSYISYQPLGIILGIMPWNFPLWQVIRFAIPTLSAGNVVLLKHAPNVLGCSKSLENLFLEAGFPEGVFQSIVVETESIKAIIGDSRIKGVSLTGSESAGRAVASLAGNHIKKSVLELGGNDPFVVCKDADLDKAVAAAIQSRMQNAGQVCISAKRIIVEQSVKDEFNSRFLKLVPNWTPGDPTLPSTKMGPLARIDLAENIEKQYNEAVKHGAVSLTNYHRDNCLVYPMVLDNVCHASIAFREETFGPLAAIISAKTEEYAIALANDSCFGLGATIFTEDREKGERLAQSINTGTVFVNEPVRSDPRFPVGGINNSGYGRELGSMGLMEFVNVKSLIVN